MAHKGWLVAVIIILILIGGAAYGVVTFNFSALPDPGGTETSVISSLRESSIRRGARNLPASPIVNNADAVSQGHTLYAKECAQCHGPDGREPTTMGSSMYPRVPSLSSPDTQEMSDKEIFWVIKNGIRFSGMPGFANINSDPQMWQITYYLRSLGARAKKPALANQQ